MTNCPLFVNVKILLTEKQSIPIKKPTKIATLLLSNSIIVIRLKQDNFTRNYLVLQSEPKKQVFPKNRKTKSGKQKNQLKFEVNHDDLIFA